MEGESDWVILVGFHVEVRGYDPHIFFHWRVKVIGSFGKFFLDGSLIFSFSGGRSKLVSSLSFFFSDRQPHIFFHWRVKKIGFLLEEIWYRWWATKLNVFELILIFKNIFLKIRGCALLVKYGILSFISFIVLSFAFETN